jgi:hypothetical protein
MRFLHIIIAMVIVAGCAQRNYPHIKFTEEQLVRDCHYLATISETSDPAILFFRFREFSQNRVLQRAERLGATHVVWLQNYTPGSAALVYRCQNQHDCISLEE